MKNPLSHDVKYMVLLTVILVVAALLRGWYLLEILEAPDFASLRQDMSVQDYQARAMLSGDWTVPEDRSDPEIPTTPYYRPPGYTYLLATLYFFSGGSYLFPRVFNMLLGLASILLMARLARILFGNAISLLCAALMATYWGFIYYEGEINDPATFVFLLPCLLLSLRQWGVTRAARWAALAGLITGAYALMRPNILLFGPFMAAWMLLIGLRARQYMRIARGWLALAAATAVVIAPVTMRNYAVSGEFVPISTYFGQNLHIGNSEYSDGYTSWTPYLQELEGTGRFSVWEYAHMVHGLGREVGNEHLTHSEASRIFGRKAVDWIRKNKTAALRLTLKKAVLFWSPVEITENKVVHYEKKHYRPLKYLPGFPYVAALFWGGLALLIYDWRRRQLPASPLNATDVTTNDMLLILLALLLTYYISFLPFFVNARARHPMVGLMMLFGAYGLWRIGYAWRTAGIKRALPLSLLLLVLYGAACIEVYPYTPDRARWHYARADSWLRTGALDKAAAEAETMLSEEFSYYMPFRLGHAFALRGRHELAARLLRAALSPTAEEQPVPYRQDLFFHIGAALQAAGQLEEARDAFQEALRLNPRDPRALNDLGVIMEEEENLQEALGYYQAAVEAQPDFTLAQSNLGNLHGRLGDHQGAVEAFSRAVEAAPEIVEYHYNLAVHLAATGNVAAAVMRYRTTLDMAPEDVRALNNLALLLKGLDRIEEAQSLLEKAIELAPDYALARANLGNLYFEQGLVEQGTAVYLDGLALTPENTELHNGLGYQYALHGQADQARAQYLQALAIEPDYTRARVNLALLCIDAGKIKEALEHFQRLHEQQPDAPQWLLEMGNMHARLHQKEAAIQCYRRALERDPDFEAAQQNLNALTGASLSKDAAS